MQFFPQNIITTQTLQIIDFNSMSDNVKIGTFMLKISRLLLLKDFGKKISVSRKLDVFVKRRCLWPQQSPYEG